MATEAVLKYLAETNRPYSANDITLNMHKEFGKTAVQKALDELALQGSIREKVYGKQKVYCIIQEVDDGSGGTAVDNELKELEQAIAEKTQAVSSVESDYRHSESLLRELSSSATTEDLVADNGRLAKANAVLEKKLTALKETTKAVSKDERDKTAKRHSAAVREYRKRKRICRDILDAVLENYPKEKKHLYDEIGIETDEDVKMPQLTLA